MLQYYSASIAAIKQHFVLNTVLQNISDLFKFRYTIKLQHCYLTTLV